MENMEPFEYSNIRLNHKHSGFSTVETKNLKLKTDKIAEFKTNKITEPKIDEIVESKLDKITEPKLDEIAELKTELNKININQYILDPLSVIIQLSILANKPIGTKICIYKNAIHIQEIGIFQSTVRIAFNNSKFDIQYLYNPIEIACKTYLTKSFQNNLSNIKLLFQNANKGIKKLIETYNECEILKHSLYLYQNIIENYLNENFNDRLFKLDNISEIYTEEILKKCNDIWINQDNNKIKLVLNFINFFENEENVKNVKCLQEFMYSINDIIFNAIN